jgi:hypothetical protein
VVVVVVAWRGAMDISWEDVGDVIGGGEEEDARGVDTGRGDVGCSSVVVVGEFGSEPEVVVKYAEVGVTMDGAALGLPSAAAVLVMIVGLTRRGGEGDVDAGAAEGGERECVGKFKSKLFL